MACLLCYLLAVVCCDASLLLSTRRAPDPHRRPPDHVAAVPLRLGSGVRTSGVVPLAPAALASTSDALCVCVRCRWDQLGELLGQAWAQDVTQYQLHKCLASINSSVLPLRTLANLGAGAADLVLLPLKQYRKDGRIGVGLVRGASSFARKAVVETIGAASRVASGAQVCGCWRHVACVVHRCWPSCAHCAVCVCTVRGLCALRQSILEDLDDIVSQGPQPLTVASRRRQRLGHRRRQRHLSATSHVPHVRRSTQASQPAGVLDGLSQAYDSLTRGMREAVHTIVAVPKSEYKRHGAHGAIKAAVRGVPVAVLRPIIGTTEAVARTLLGTWFPAPCCRANSLTLPVAYRCPGLR